MSLNSTDSLTSEVNELHYTFKRFDHFNVAVGYTKTEREEVCYSL